LLQHHDAGWGFKRPDGRSNPGLGLKGCSCCLWTASLAPMSPLVCLLRLWRGSRKPHLGSLPGRGRQVCVERQTGVAPLVWRLGGSARPFQGGHSPFPWCHSAYVLHSSRTGVAASSSLAVARQLARNAPRLNEGAWQLLIAKIGRKMAQFGRSLSLSPRASPQQVLRPGSTCLLQPLQEREISLSLQSCPQVYQRRTAR
jgi:hypothetical protein